MFKLKDFNFKNKKVLIRVDFNVPVDEKGNITDDSRIRKAIPTLQFLMKQKPEKIIIISHFGRPKGEYAPEYSMKPVCIRLEQLLKAKVHFQPTPKIMNIPSIDNEKIIMLENLRFDKAEEENKDDFSQKLASFADYFVFDAFGASHRAHASVSGVPKHIPSCPGLLMEKEVQFLRDNMQSPDKPFVAIIGGAKADKINVINALLQKVDALIIGGVLANTFLKIKGVNIGDSKFSEESLEYAKQVLQKYPNKIALPVDYIVGDSFSAQAKTKVAGEKDDISGWMIMDIGPYTISGYCNMLKKAKTVVWAGPIGVFEWEAFRRGTWDVARTLASLNITKIIGGGDSGEAIEKFGLAEKMTHVSTGGGASLELLAGHQLPGISALEENEKSFKGQIK
ncbi:phosphoglycerate kinase [Candidatus Woesearchaeota archaeon]|nr:phosphoglycerate kinase [Candidatus Woesearchaeota archaeon]